MDMPLTLLPATEPKPSNLVDQVIEKTPFLHSYTGTQVCTGNEKMALLTDDFSSYSAVL